MTSSAPARTAADNTVVVTPPPSAPLATVRVVRRIAESLPPGVVNVVTGEDADIDDAIAAANDTWAGLCSSVWTEDQRRASEVGSLLSSGYTWVTNHGAAFLDERAPFGGLRSSGIGREMGILRLREFMDTQCVSFPDLV